MPPPGSLPSPPELGSASPKSVRTAAPPPEVRPTSRVQASYKELAQAAINLNVASDELGNAIAVLDASLKKLNLGVAAWVTLSSGDGSSRGQDWWWSRDFGYAKVRDKWGIALRTSSGDGNYIDEDSEELWLFNDAPRWMRIEAVGKIPDLLDALLKQAQDTAKGIEKKTAQALELASAISTIAEETQPEART
jgi:hypothetical protein